MKKYTVVLSYPDYTQNGNEGETFMAHVEARSPILAAKKAMRLAFAQNHGSIDNWGDFGIVAVFAGHHDDLKTH